jgi:hypothetical protein
MRMIFLTSHSTSRFGIVQYLRFSLRRPRNLRKSDVQRMRGRVLQLAAVLSGQFTIFMQILVELLPICISTGVSTHTGINRYDFSPAVANWQQVNEL